MTAIEKPEPSDAGAMSFNNMASEEKNLMPDLSRHQATNGSGITGNIVGDDDADVSDAIGHATNGAGNGSAERCGRRSSGHCATTA
jgi:hypothetical protein